MRVLQTAEAPDEQHNRYNLNELAGAFGDVGTLIPFALIYFSALNFNPGILFSFGAAYICLGLYFRTPVPAQPMKAIGTAVATQAGMLTPGMIWGAGLFTGVFWVVLALTGTVQFVSSLVKKPVVKGIILGLSLSFLIKGTEAIISAPLIGLAGLALTWIFAKNKKVPVIFLLLAFGVAAALLRKPVLLNELLLVRPHLQFPTIRLFPYSWTELIKGAMLLALPQVPMTLGNGIIAMAAKNNEAYPSRPVTEREVAMSTGLMNLFSQAVGGVPMCHGAGGMAAHQRFGARSGGATVIFGTLLLFLALFFSHSMPLFFEFIPPAVLGVMMIFVGVELAGSAWETGLRKQDFALLIGTAGISLWNMGIAFFGAVFLQYLFDKLKPIKSTRVPPEGSEFLGCRKRVGR